MKETGNIYQQFSSSDKGSRSDIHQKTPSEKKIKPLNLDRERMKQSMRQEELKAHNDQAQAIWQINDRAAKQEIARDKGKKNYPSYEISYQIPPESRSYWEVLLQAKEAYPQHFSDYSNPTSLDQRPNPSMRQRDITEGKKSFKDYILKHEYEAFKSGKRMKRNKISETKFPIRERLVYMMYNKFRSIQKRTEYHYTDVQVQDEINQIRRTKEYKEAFPGAHEGMIVSLGNEGSSSQQQREVVVLSDSKEDREKSPKQKQPSESQSREGEKRRSDQEQEGAHHNKRPKHDFVTLHEQQQETSMGDQRDILQERKSEISEYTRKFINGQSSDFGKNFLKTQEELEYAYQIVDSMNLVQSSRKDHVKRLLSYDNSLYEQQQEADLSHRTEELPVMLNRQHHWESTSQRTDVRRQGQCKQIWEYLVQQYEGQDQAGSSRQRDAQPTRAEKRQDTASFSYIPGQFPPVDTPTIAPRSGTNPIYIIDNTMTKPHYKWVKPRPETQREQ